MLDRSGITGPVSNSHIRLRVPVISVSVDDQLGFHESEVGLPSTEHRLVHDKREMTPFELSVKGKLDRCHSGREVLLEPGLPNLVSSFWSEPALSPRQIKLGDALGGCKRRVPLQCLGNGGSVRCVGPYVLGSAGFATETTRRARVTFRQCYPTFLTSRGHAMSAPPCAQVAVHRAIDSYVSMIVPAFEIKNDPAGGAAFEPTSVTPSRVSMCRGEYISACRAIALTNHSVIIRFKIDLNREYLEKIAIGRNQQLGMLEPAS